MGEPVSARYRTIVADPPWPQPLMGRRRSPVSAKRPNGRSPAPRTVLPYPTMTVAAIAALPVADLAEVGAHLWLWTTNAFLRQGFDVLAAWGFTYLAPITWVKPSGVGNYFVHRTQTCLFGYRERCTFPLERYHPTVFTTGWPHPHSAKPEAFIDLVERISPPPRVELFARRHRLGWDVLGDAFDDRDIAAVLG
jgi:N6-adenosine-specific RNA methylase IME4